MLLINAPHASESAAIRPAEAASPTPSRAAESYRSDHEAEALFREAKRRARKRRVAAAAGPLILLGSAIYFGILSGTSHGKAIRAGSLQPSSAAVGRLAISSATITTVTEKLNSRGQVMGGGSEVVSTTFGGGRLLYQVRFCPFPAPAPGAVAAARPQCEATPQAVTIVGSRTVTSYRAVAPCSAICTSVCVRTSRDWYVIPIETSSVKDAVVNVRAVANHYSPATVLGDLQNVARRPFRRVKGPVVVAGVPTTEYAVQFKRSLSLSRQAARSGPYAASVWTFVRGGSATDIWLDSHGQLRQLESRGPLRGAIGHQWATVEITTFSNFNHTVVPQPLRGDVLFVGKYNKLEICAPSVASTCSR